MTNASKSRISGRLDLHAVALDAIHHGAGVSGNTQILRVQEIVTPDGRAARVPFVSGNSIKHMIRDGAVRFALDAMAVEDGSLSKPVVDLLFSGGRLTKGGGGAVRLDSARRLEELFPALSLCGYSAGNYMAGSKIRCSNLHLVCAENTWRVPPQLGDHPMLVLRAGALRGEEFGTRHDAARLPAAKRVLALADLRQQEVALGKRADGDVSKLDTTQMIYDYQTVVAGSHWWGWIEITDLPEGELSAFRSGLSMACQGRHTDGGYIFAVGAKSSIGLGRISIAFAGSIRAPVAAPAYESTDLLPADESGLSGYVRGLRSQREEILSTLQEMA